MIIPVWDLLHKQWSKDTIPLKDVALIDEYILLEGNILLQSISDAEIIAQFMWLKSSKHTICDLCGVDLLVQYESKPELIHFMKDFDLYSENQPDICYPIEHDQTIDVLPAVQSCVLLYDDIQHVCMSCKSKKHEDDDSYDGIWISNVSFTYT